jgi:hypothetical protein
MLGVMTAGLDMMMFGMAGMAVGAVGVVRRFFVIAGFMMFRRFAMMLRGVFVMFSGLVMMRYACVIAHNALPDCSCENATPVYARPLTLC